MARAHVTTLRTVDFGVTDLAARHKFYTEIWGLATVAEIDGSVYLRGTGPHHHIVALHQRKQAEMLRIDLLAPDRQAVAALRAEVSAAGATEVEAPAAITEPGGGYGFAFKDPEGRTVRILCGDQTHADAGPARDRPRKLSHCVLNSADPTRVTEFYQRALGFTLSDQTAAMTFIRCNSDHHSIAFVKAPHPSLHHVAFEMPEIESVMRGAGRMRDAGFPIEWGVGRHGPGNNVFAYFLSPDDMVIEYTAEVEQVDERYVAHGPDYWRWPEGRSDHWGIAVGPTERMRASHDRITFAPDLFHPAG
jgi:catechol 2,3-dioxygenase-like lactoylglutathione lyase family enzyme